MPNKKLNWALLSTARINDRIIPAIKKSKYANLYAVASRSNKNLSEYSKKRNIPIFYNSYAKLLEDKNVDVIYISLPNHLHSKWIILSAKAKKNVLCEKPITTSVKEINKIIKVVKKNNVAVQEATMMRFHPQTFFTRDIVEKKKVGKIKYISALFSIAMKNYKDIRFKYNNGGGSLWDLGSYCISFARSTLQREPVQVFAKKIHVAGKGRIDHSLAGYLIFDGKIEMHFFSSFRSFHHEEVTMIGDKGTIKVNVPYCNHVKSGSVLITKEDTNKKVESLFGDEIPLKLTKKRFNHNAYFDEVDSFSKTILYGRQQVISLDDSKKNIKALTGLLESAKSGKLITIRK
jgi:predicted dehydrogenase